MLLIQAKVAPVAKLFRRVPMLVRRVSMLRGADLVDAGGGPRIGILGLSFIAVVIIPTLIALFYNAFIASREWVAEAHFTIRAGAENQSPISDVVTAMTSWIGVSAQSTTQDVFIVSDYIKSRTIIGDIGGKKRLAEIYSRPETDWLKRLDSDASIEEMWKYWRRKVSAVIDTTSNVVTLRVRAYTAQEAVTLANEILQHSEALVNDISERIRRDALARAESEVQLAQQRLEQARADLLVFRRSNNLIDPELSAKSMSETLGKLMRDRIELDFARGSVSGTVSPDAPAQRAISAQIAALDDQISRLQAQLAGKNQDGTLASQIAGFEKLSLAVQFGERLYAISQSTYVRARVEAEKQQLYLVAIERPSLPEKHQYPRIFLDTVLTAIIAFVLWAMVSLTTAWVRDHAGG